MKKKKTEIEEIISGILGTDKFLMVNLKLVKLLNPNGALFLTYLLDKYSFLIKSKAIREGEGMYVFRREINQKLSLSNYQQKNIESELKSKGLIEVVEERVQGETFNNYYINLYNIFDLLNDETSVVETPVKNLMGG